MNRIVLDASALLALLNSEPGADRLTPQLLSMAASSTVNLAEVQAKLVLSGLDPDDAWEAALTPIREVVDFTADHARLAGMLVAQTRSLGLSLGDRACLALGMILKAPVYTSDKTWKNLKLGIQIHVIR
ncbi:MAG TPA: type II toxin-antitoxin system VapC family toxin [Candidatus Angelobacter sp.]|jgi:PIN domain nuclease of toxin-antitoxin system|nr:type II toxin-antitoxin system VapC family toxin [Candidatus Angelobacter sp.]